MVASAPHRYIEEFGLSVSVLVCPSNAPRVSSSSVWVLSQKNGVRCLCVYVCLFCYMFVEGLVLWTDLRRDL